MELSFALELAIESARTAGDLLSQGLTAEKTIKNKSPEVDNVLQLAAFLKKALGIRRDGSAALDLAYVAAGRFDGFWEFRLSNWDVAAGACLVQEAGGQISSVDGQPWTISPYNSLIASNGRIHADMENVLSAINQTVIGNLAQPNSGILQ